MSTRCVIRNRSPPPGSFATGSMKRCSWSIIRRLKRAKSPPSTPPRARRAPRSPSWNRRRSRAGRWPMGPSSRSRDEVRNKIGGCLRKFYHPVGPQEWFNALPAVATSSDRINNFWAAWRTVLHDGLPEMG